MTFVFLSIIFGAIYYEVNNRFHVSSLEIKTSFLAPTRAGNLRVEGWVIKQSYKTAFMEGHIYNEDNELTATASTVAKLLRAPKQ